MRSKVIDVRKTDNVEEMTEGQAYDNKYESYLAIGTVRRKVYHDNFSSVLDSTYVSR